MCIGIPMQVIESHPGFALCDNGGVQQRVDTALVGPQPAGSWLLVFLGAAREVLSEQRARQVRQALLAMKAVADGRADEGALLDSLFSDLLKREPELPPHLAEQISPNAK
ncbi:HypC/HybG/HupF family hydrogenase formation chaperone [Marinobacterium arenosum]|uniref:HypC/HybG/HupF family hydrogenase formation chaperone n=1 Tax=Marinobacterium arenosum TaxID=2862496 RepID=UPI001C93CE00|nr:HypC/HybG/HupF family hydrogenase formation chaperone [Marinobacterium arenosum]MBY4677398.1 HypC/HybG/HupF family hydrogenase formation chaperone [Marinobacterium arenosum]